MKVKISTFVNRFIIEAIMYSAVTSVWFALSDQTSKMFIYFGFTSSFVSILICKRFGLLKGEATFNFIGLYKFFSYCAWLLKEIFYSSVDVSRRIWNDRLTSNSGFCKLHLPKTNNIGLISFANSITLTPGTITIYISNKELVVHTLDKALEESLIKSNHLMMKKVNEFANRSMIYDLNNDSV